MYRFFIPFFPENVARISIAADRGIGADQIEALKKGEWKIGPKSSAAEKIIAWIDQMMSVKTGQNPYVVEEI